LYSCPILLPVSGYAVGLIFDELSKDGQYQTVAVEVSDTNDRLAYAHSQEFSTVEGQATAVKMVPIDYNLVMRILLKPPPGSV
jgi:hypothetical protein